MQLGIKVVFSDCKQIFRKLWVLQFSSQQAMLDWGSTSHSALIKLRPSACGLWLKRGGLALPVSWSRTENICLDGQEDGTDSQRGAKGYRSFTRVSSKCSFTTCYKCLKWARKDPKDKRRKQNSTIWRMWYTFRFATDLWAEENSADSSSITACWHECVAWR